MAMKTASPWWFSALVAAGLVFVFLGERAFGHLDTVRLVFTGAGLALLVATTALRLWTWTGTEGARRKVERTLLLCHAGIGVALVGYLLTTQWGRDLVGIDGGDPEALARYQIPMTVLWGIVMAVSLVPLVMVELSLGTAQRTEFKPGDLHGKGTPDAAVESYRVREMAISGVSLALALAFLMTTCSIADQRNIRRDVSYFKTSSPGGATISAVKTQSEGIKVLLFFPPVNPVGDEVRGYFEALADAAGNVVIETLDHRVSPELAKQYKVTKEGTVVLVQGDKNESIKLEADPELARTRARSQLRDFDRKVNAALLKVIRERRTVYLTVGHGEINDPDAKLAKALGPQANEIRKLLADLNYDVKELSLVQGLGNEVPEDADLVIVLSPRQPLLDEEIGALDQYLARGGRMLIALDPQGEATLGVLEGRLGVTFNAAPVTDDKEHLVQSRTLADRRLLITNRFSSHAAITTLTRGQDRKGILFINAGSFDDAPFTVQPPPQRTYVVKSMASSFRDTTDAATGRQNFTFDAETEKRQEYNLVAVIEGPPEIPPPPEPEPAEGDKDKKKKSDNHDMRVMVVGDAEIFADQVQLRVPATGELFTDAVKWLGGEEYIAGEIVSEKDVYIEHTQSEDAVWFYATIVGAPFLVLGFGLWFSWWRRRSSKRAGRSS